MLPTTKVKEEPADKGYESVTKTTTRTVTVVSSSLPKSRLSTGRPITVSASKNLSNVTPILQAMSNSVQLNSSSRAPVILTPAGTSGSQTRPVILLPATSLAGSGAQSILLQRAPLQAKSLIGNKHPQSLLAAGRTLFHIKGGNITSAVNLSSVASSVAGAKGITVGQVRPTTIQPSSATSVPVAASPIMALCAKNQVTDTSLSKARTVCGVVFNSRTLDAIGNPKSTKEYLCNFCQFKTELHHVFNKHLNSHIFSCNHCSYKAFTRYEVITHKRDVHPQFRHELQGFEGFGIDDSRLTNGTFLSPTSQTSTPTVTSMLSSAIPKNPIIIAPPTTMTTTTITTGATLSTSAAVATKVTTSQPGRQKSGSYFTYKIVHDASTGKPQSYECDICKFRTPNLTDMYTHAATHTLADLQKRGSDNIMWECFYCTFNAGKQNEVVEHVTKDHPGKPIQLKRYTSDKAAKEKSDKAIAEANKEKEWPVPVSSIKTEKPDRDEEPSEEENCLWGCTYCKTQVPKREEIIDHVRKEHPGKKLVITRRRLNKPAARVDSDKKRASQSKEEEKEKESDREKTSDSDSEKQKGSSKKKEEKSTSEDVSPSPRPTDAPPSGRSSRRKQTLPRKVRDSSIDSDDKGDKEPAESNDGAPSSSAAATDDDDDTASLGNPTAEQLNLQISDPVGISPFPRNGKDSKGRSNKGTEKSAAKGGPTADSPESMSPGMKRKSKYDLLIAMMKKDNLDNEKQLRALAKDGSPILTSTNSDSKTVLLHSPPMVSLLKGKNLQSLLTKRPGPKSKTSKTSWKDAELEAEAAKADVVFLDSIPDDLQIDHSQHYVYNRNKMTAKCNLCSHTTEGKHCLAHIKEHVMIHTGERLWGCPYCDFKCNRRISMFKHVKSRHPAEPVRLIRRKPYQHPGQRNKLLQSAAGISYSQGASAPDDKPEPKLRGPRSVRERKALLTAKHMWQCPYCPRQSVFYGMMKIHVKLVHPQNYAKDGEISFVRQARPRGSPDQLMQQNRIWLKNAKVHLVRYEDMDKYPVLDDMLEDHGDSLVQDLDIDPDELPSSPKQIKVESPPKAAKKPAPERKPSLNRMKYCCCHCDERASRPSIIKDHMIEAHPGKPLEVMDMRAKSLKRERKLYMCKHTECDFQSYLKEALYAHIGKNPEHYYDENLPTDDMAENGGTPIDPILKITSRCSSLRPARPRSVRYVEPDPIDEILDAADTYMGDESPPVLEPVGKAKVEKTPPSGADSERDSSPGTPMLTPPAKQLTLNPLECIDINGMELKCRYCDFLNSGEPIAMKDHLTSAHPRKDPIAIDVLAREKRKTAGVFICQLLFCNFATYNQPHFLRHLKEEHPDMEFLVPLGDREAAPVGASKRTPKTDWDEEDDDPSYGAKKPTPAQKKKRAAKARARRMRKKVSRSDLTADSDQFSELPDGLEPETEPVEPGPTPGQPKSTPADPPSDVEAAPPQTPTETKTKQRPARTKASTASGNNSNSFVGDIDDKYTIDGTLLKTPRTTTPKPVHFPERFQCKATRCSTRFDSLSDMKGHLLHDHPDVALLVCADLRAKQLRKKSKVFFCREEKCRAFFKVEEELFKHSCLKESAQTPSDPENMSQKSIGEAGSPGSAVNGDGEGEQREAAVAAAEEEPNPADSKPSTDRARSEHSEGGSPRSGSRHSVSRQSSPRHSGSRDSGSRHSSPRHSCSRQSSPRHSGSRHSGSQHSSPRHPGSGHSSPRHSGSGHSSPRHPGSGHPSPWRPSQESISDIDNQTIKTDNGEEGDKVYQCSYCTYISTRLDNIQSHCVEEHECKEGGFTAIESGFSTDGRLVMNVNEKSEPQSARRRPSGVESMKSEDSEAGDKQDNGPELGSDRVSGHGSDRESGRGSDRESARGSDRESARGSDRGPDLMPQLPVAAESRKRRRSSSDSAKADLTKKPCLEKEIETPVVRMEIESSKTKYRDKKDSDQDDNDSSDDEKSFADDEEEDEKDGGKDDDGEEEEDAEEEEDGNEEKEDRPGGGKEGEKAKDNDDKSHSGSSSDESGNEGEGATNKKDDSDDNQEDDKKASGSSASDTDEEPGEENGAKNSRAGGDQPTSSKEGTAKTGDTSQSDTSSSSSSSSSSSEDEEESSN